MRMFRLEFLGLCGLLLALLAVLAGCPPEGMGSAEFTAPAPQAIIEVNESEWIAARRAQTGKYSEISVTCSYAPLPVLFEGWKSKTREEIIDYAWDFGDGSPGFHGFNAAHVYETPGEYTATLTVTNCYGLKSTATQTIEVLAPSGQTYYVDAQLGNDSNPGTSPGAGAWRTALYAFTGIGQERYGLGDRILFKRGQVFPVPTVTIGFTHWENGYGYMFGAHGTGPKPLFQLTGAESGRLFNNGSVGLAYFALVDLAFDLTSAEGAKAMFWRNSGDVQNILFLRRDIQNFDQAIVFSGAAKPHFGVYIVDCTFSNSLVTHLFASASHYVLLNNRADFSNNHIAYLPTVDVGLIAGNNFTRPAFGRQALRVAGAGLPETCSSNVLIKGNTFKGWIDPETVGPAHNGNGNRYNALIVQLGDNTGNDLQTLRDCVFEENTVEDGEVLIMFSSCENVIARRNTFASVDTNPAGRVKIGSEFETWGLRPITGLDFVENTIIARPCAYATPNSIIEVFKYKGPEYKGKTQHEDIVIERNLIIMEQGKSRLLSFRENDNALVTSVKSENHVVYTTDHAALYQMGGDYRNPGDIYDLPDWQSLTGHETATQVYGSRELPAPGWAASPPKATPGPMAVSYWGAIDYSGAGLKRVRLWKRENGGPWQNTGLSAKGAAGSFQVPGLAPGVTYEFATQAEDNAGNISPAPVGRGHTTTACVGHKSALAAPLDLKTHGRGSGLAAPAAVKTARAGNRFAINSGQRRPYLDQFDASPAEGGGPGERGGEHHPPDAIWGDSVNAMDVQVVINEALGIDIGYDCDLNGGGLVNAADVQLVINAALGL